MFHEILYTLRKESGLTQIEVANVCNLSKRQYIRIEKGEQKPNYDCLVRLAECFYVSLDYLAGRTDVRENPNVPSTIRDKSEK